MSKNTNKDGKWSSGMGKTGLFLIPVSDKGGMGNEPTKAFMDELIASMKADLDGDSRLIETRTNQEACRINAEIKKNTVYICETPLDAIDMIEQAQQRGEEVYFRPPSFVFFGKEAVDSFDARREEEDRQRQGVQAALEAGAPSLNADEVKQDTIGRTPRMLGYVRKNSVGYDIKIEPQKLEALENAVHWKHLSSTIDDGELKPHLHYVFPNVVRHELPPEDTRVVIHTFRPRTKGNSSFSGRLADIYRGAAGLPLAGTVFDPRRYRRIK